MTQGGAPGRIRDLIAQEIDSYSTDTVIARNTLAAFRADLAPDPHPEEVTFSGGIRHECWSVTRGDGHYRVFYMPSAGYFALCVESDFGPLDIGVHGPAIGCFSSV